MTTARRRRQRSRRIVTVSIFSRLTRGQRSFFGRDACRVACKCGSSPLIREMDRAINLTFHGVGEPQRRLDPGEADVWVSRERFLSILDSVTDRADVRITFDDGNASDVDPRPARAARARTGGDVLRRRRPAGRPALPRRRRRQGARGRRDDDRLATACAIAPGAASTTARCARSSSTPRRCSRTSSAARSRRPRARSALTTAGCCAGCAGRATTTCTRATAARPARASSCRPATASARTTSRPCSSRSRALDAPADRALPRRAKLAVKRWR